MQQNASYLSDEKLCAPPPRQGPGHIFDRKKEDGEKTVLNISHTDKLKSRQGKEVYRASESFWN